MITLKLYGGLGNQLFQYAAARSISLKIQQQIAFDLSWFSNTPPEDTPRKFELDKFCLSPDIKILTRPPGSVTSRIKRTEHINDTSLDKIQAILSGKLSPANLVMDGYWQNYHYFSDIRPQLLEEFKLKSLSSQASKVIEGINGETIAIQVRRGDYLTDNRLKGFLEPLDIGYYQKSVKLLESRKPEPARAKNFLISSDDIDWCRQNFKWLEGEVKFIELSGSDAAVQSLECLSKCGDFIIANSTYGWWTAWLSTSPGRTIITPKNWHANNADLSDNMIPGTSQFDATWIRL